ncbi:hypothetical protein MUK60_00340 [Streptomyces sp. LRE541]|uniref:hypothetical protein n=1 Tax=Streptomyces sp. LRE541 TaxID=2931983 RepID=UPI00200E97BE|nr:hypothetical protein [Streptomyces sp. LRE541]UPZ26399.1 hypothetical protein MUK60_00340 [Streptomyces sp. LRE541]
MATSLGAFAATALLAAAVPPSTHAAPAPAQEQSYVVEVVNRMRISVDDVNLALARHSDPTIRPMTQRRVVPGATASFDLGACSDVRQFAASAFIGSREVLHTGNIDPSPGCHTRIEITQN